MGSRHPIRNAMYNIGMLHEMHGLRGSEVTIAEVLSDAGYATAFHGKWHLGDIEESYAHNQGFDEAFFTGYNQILSLWTRRGEAANATIGLGRIMAKLKELGIAENTLVVCMADNGPMSHNPPPGCGFAQTIFRGGKGDFLEGGVRVPAQAWWPGTIGAGQLVGDIIHEADLYTTFARLAGATKGIPTDRIIDGIDQTSLLLNGDTFSHRDHVFIYAGPKLGATVKGNYKRHWISSDPIGEASGIAAGFYFLP